MKQQAFLQMDEGTEHEEQIYLLEVLVDSIRVEEAKVPGYLLEPYGPLVVKAKFLDFPDLEFDQGKCPGDLEAVAAKIIAGCPESWKIELAKDQPDFEQYPQYRVIIPVVRPSSSQDVEQEDSVQVLVPQSVIVTGEGLRYINTVLKTELSSSAFQLVHEQMEKELHRNIKNGTLKISEYTFSAGKSLLFPMTPFKLIESLRKSPLYLQVTRSGMYANDKPFFTLIGQVKLLLGNSFVKAIMVAGNTKVLPVSAHIEDQYPISNVFGEETGTVSIFLRLSCFGKSMFETNKGDFSSMPSPPELQSSEKRKFRPLYTDESDKPLTFGSPNDVADKYSIPVPWRKPWDDLPEFPKPPPVLPPFYEPLPPLPPPPPPTKPFDIGEHLPDLPRCSPRQPPPCYRKAGDPPLSYCTRELEAQLRREDTTKYTQTDSEPKLKNKTSRKESLNKINTDESQAPVDSYKSNNERNGNTECDGMNFNTEPLQEQGCNLFDGNPANQNCSKEEIEIKSTSKRDKKCTCPKIPNILLPQQLQKPECGCRCALIKAQLTQGKEIIKAVNEKLSEEPESIEGSESNKERPEKIQKHEEQKTVKKTESQSSIVKKKIIKPTPSKPMKDNVFYLPGVDSSTFIAVTSQACGYDLKRYLQKARERGEFDLVRKYIEPDPLANLKLNELPEDVKKGFEKQIRKMEEKKPANENWESKSPPIPKKRNSVHCDKPQKEESQISEKIPVTKTDGGKTGDDSSHSKPAKPNKKEQRIKAKIRASNIYEYTAGMYPGIHVGHKYCVRPLRLVPKTMGWLWNVSDLGGALKPGRGWRPGAVRRNVNNLLREWRKTNKGVREMKAEQEMDMMMMTTKSKRIRPITPKSQGSKKDPDTLKLNPTIHLHKKDRFYYISMYPVKTESQEELGEEPQPIQFKIDRKHPDGVPSGDASCLSSTQSSSDSSSYEVEYIAPAAMKQKKRKVEKSHMFSQYDEEDFMPKKIIKKGTKPAEEQPEAGKKLEDKSKKGKKGGKKDTKKGGKKKK